MYSASNIAASSIAASLSGLNWHSKSRISIYDLVDKLAEISDSESVSRFFFLENFLRPDIPSFSPLKFLSNIPSLDVRKYANILRT